MGKDTPPQDAEAKSYREVWRRTGEFIDSILHSTTMSFEELFKAESVRIDKARQSLEMNTTDEAEPQFKAPADGEPWVHRAADDRLGISLSGGGIRSATFNLGLLQSLSRGSTAEGSESSILGQVDYLSTVSGGGYIGGFWSAWLKASREGGKDLDPTRVFPNTASGGVEAPELRHLRERSRFLVPRIGFFEGQTWTGVIAVLGSTIPSVILASALLVIFWALWGTLAFALFASDWLGAIVVSVLTSIIVLIAESVRRQRLRGAWEPEQRFPLPAIASVLATGLSWWAFASWVEVPQALNWTGSWDALMNQSRMHHLDFAVVVRELVVSKGWELLWPAACWLIVPAFVLCVIRPVRCVGDNTQASCERVAAYCLVPALLWIALGSLSVSVVELGESDSLSASLSATLVGGALLTWFRNWLLQPVSQSGREGSVTRLVSVLRPVVPQVLAYGVFLGMLWSVALLMYLASHRRVPVCKPDSDWCLPSWMGIDLATASAGLALLLWIGALVFLEPTRVGLHDFYRKRLGATFLAPSSNDYEGDFRLGELKHDCLRPIHLVCTTANELWGDPLHTLHRGGRSVAISPVALSIGNSARAMDHLKFSSVLAASAAAFNSQMGRVTRHLGRVVSFVMSALGLRLGLWTRAPGAGPLQRWFSGLPLLLDMLGYSQAPVRRGDQTGYLHLSDGGHFENLAIYELVRRHCRYIIVSDCGADPDLAFDDLANATRLIREDFGVELELDVDPLRPNSEGMSQQHVVVGRIHYDGAEGMDKGTIIYFKPTLVGGEPTDVTQYKTRNPQFPHESTADQFYDEAQWEAYRRLGEHCGEVVFRHGRAGLARNNAVERLFMDAASRWHQPRDVYPDRLRQLAARREALLTEIRSDAPLWFQAELFPEVIASNESVKLATPTATPLRTEAEELHALSYCLQLASLIEEVWVAASLETQSAHPCNQVWMTYTYRFVTCETFRRWWLVIRPLVRNAVRDFLNDKFELCVTDSDTRPTRDGPREHISSARLELRKVEPAAVGEFLSHQSKRRVSQVLRGPLLAYQALLPGTQERRFDVGLLSYTTGNSCARWRYSDLFVLPMLDGAGVSSRMLDAVVRHFEDQSVGSLEVELVPPQRASGNASSLDSTHALHFYKSRGFEQSARGDHILIKRLSSYVL